jgi:hypothetical protein
MKKTQTYLVDVERLLREKLSSLQSQDIEMRRLASEREIVEAKRTEAFKATIKGENQRINMRLHFEREQAERDREQNIKDQVREGRRQTVENLGTHIQMLSTNVMVKEGLLSETLADQQAKLRQLMRELENTQRRILMSHQVKESLEVKKTIQQTTGGVKGKVGDAVANLTMFTKEATDDVREIKLKLENTSAELMEREKVTRKQDNNIKKLQEEVAVNERKMESYEHKTVVLKAQNDANGTTDWSK